MITFDLSDKNSTNFVIQSFPDGQQQVWIRDGKSLYEKEVDVRCRLTNFMDLEILICCCKSLRLLGVSNINVAILYFLGARSDRKFEDGSNNYLRDVICPIINSLNFSSVLVLDPHIGAIYGDSITLERAKLICERLKEKGFASTNVVFGIGSYTYQYNTRDTFGFAMKATYGEVLETSVHNTLSKVGREIFKDPVTDDGTKRSKKGLLLVGQNIDGDIWVEDQKSWEEESIGLLQTVFHNGLLFKEISLEDIRSKLKIK